MSLNVVLVLAALLVLLVYYLHKSVRLITEIRDATSKLDAKLDDVTRRVARIDENVYTMNYPK